MKFKATKKQMLEGYSKIISVGYCNIDYLLRYEAAIAYSAGRDGWSCDYYDIGGTLISTGYAPLGGKAVSVDYETSQKYNELACEIACDYSIEWSTKKEKVRSLLEEFIQEVL